MEDLRLHSVGPSLLLEDPVSLPASRKAGLSSWWIQMLLSARNHCPHLPLGTTGEWLISLLIYNSAKTRLLPPP